MELYTLDMIKATEKPFSLIIYSFALIIDTPVLDVRLNEYVRRILKLPEYPCRNHRPGSCRQPIVWLLTFDECPETQEGGDQSARRPRAHEAHASFHGC